VADQDPGDGHGTVDPGSGTGPGGAAGSGAESGAGADQLGTAEVSADVTVRAPAGTVFAAFTAWERQGEWIPLTRVRVVSGDGGVGSVIEAVTVAGPATLRDEMRVVKVDPPYELRVVHFGRWLRGPGVMRCTPLRGERTHLVWHEWFQLPGGDSGRLAWPLLWPGAKIGLTLALRRFARLVESGTLP
jgi:Polyketide cyclase / dehydrase and lipid transport